jgi:hypothetical protein
MGKYFELVEYGNPKCEHRHIVTDTSTADAGWFVCLDCKGRGQLIDTEPRARIVGTDGR